MARRLLDYDAQFGTQTFHDYDHATKVTTIEVVQDVAPYLEANKVRQNFDSGGGGGLNARSQKQIKAGWWQPASIPNQVIAQWKQEGVDVFDDNDWPEVRRRLNSREWQFLRTNPGRI